MLFAAFFATGLVLAAFDLIRLPSRLLDPAAAAMVVYVAAENLVLGFWDVRTGDRMLLAPAFGLIQGLGLSPGFSSLLAGVGTVPAASAAAAPLAWFTLGALTSVLFPATVGLLSLRLVWSTAAFRKRVVPVLSALILLAGFARLATSLAGDQVLR